MSDFKTETERSKITEEKMLERYKVTEEKITLKSEKEPMA